MVSVRRFGILDLKFYTIKWEFLFLENISLLSCPVSSCPILFFVLTFMLRIVESKLRIIGVSQDVLAALDLSRATFNRIRLNYFWAMAYNVVMIPFAAGCFYPFTRMQVPPWLAGRCPLPRRISQNKAK
jgi:hypothetical protein